jgi:hypothetical protein
MNLPVLTLQSSDLKIGILPHAGGRLVEFLTPSGANMLRQAPELWDKQLSDIQPDTPWIDYRGHIVWLSPQSQWWAQQNLDADKQQHQSLWPPDPYLTLGKYDILKHTPTCIVLQSPVSPISGLQLNKTYQLLNDSKLLMRTQAVNQSKKQHQWGLWSNTRVPMDSQVYVQVAMGQPIKLEALRQQELDFKSLPWSITQGWFHFDQPQQLAEQQERWIKVGLHPTNQQIACFHAGYVLIKSAANPLSAPVANEHAPVELFLDFGSDLARNRMEIEMHGEQATLKPGDILNWEETWQLTSYSGPSDSASQIKWLQKQQSRK